jgi:hypothetical protein
VPANAGNTCTAEGRSARKRREGPNDPDQDKKEFIGQRREEAALKRFDAGIGLVQGIELETSVTERKRREQPKVRCFPERALAREC